MKLISEFLSRMTGGKPVYLIVAALMLLGRGTELSAQDRLRWNELESAVLGKKVTLVLSNGVRLGGKVVDVGSQTLWMQVKSTSDPEGYPKGKLSLPRYSVSVFELSKKSGSGRGVLVGIGSGLGAALLLGGLLMGASIKEGDLAPREGEDPRETNRRLKTTLIGVGAVSAGAGIAFGILGGRGHTRTSVRIISVIPEEE